MRTVERLCIMKTKKKLPSVEKLNKEMSIHDTEFMCCFYPQVKTSYTHFVWYEWIKLVYVTHGCLQCQVGSSQFTIEAGEMFFFGYNCMHYLVNATPNTQRKEIYLNIGLVLDKLNTDIFSGTYGQIKKKHAMETLVQRLDNAIQYTDESGKFSFYAIIYQMIAEMLELLAHQKKSVGTNTTLEGILTYLNLTYMKQLTLTTVSKEFGFSKQYIARLFHKYLGMSFYNYLNRLRIARAKVLLVSSELKIIDISDTCGFENERQFLYAFKKAVGITPSRYRKEKCG